MPNPTAGPATPATTAGTRPTKGTPNRRPTPPMRRVQPAAPEPLTAFDFLERIGDIGVHWWSLIEHVLELQETTTGKYQPMPDWAMRILQDQGRHEISNNEFRVQRENLREILRLAEGRESFGYEVWGDHTTRLSIRHQCIEDALVALERFKADGYPKATIVRLYVRQPGGLATDPALLETFLGKVRFAAAMIGEGPDDEDRIELQDETGRSVTLPASQLRGHPVLERVTNAKNRESLMAWLDAAQKDRP